MKLDENKVLEQFVYIYWHAKGFRGMMATHGLMTSVRMLTHSRSSKMQSSLDREKWDASCTSLCSMSPRNSNYVREHGYLNLAVSEEKRARVRSKVVAGEGRSAAYGETCPDAELQYPLCCFKHDDASIKMR